MTNELEDRLEKVAGGTEDFKREFEVGDFVMTEGPLPFDCPVAYEIIGYGPVEEEYFTYKHELKNGSKYIRSQCTINGIFFIKVSKPSWIPE